MAESPSEPAEALLDWPAVKGEIAFNPGPFGVSPEMRAGNEAMMGPVRRMRAVWAVLEGKDFFEVLKK